MFVETIEKRQNNKTIHPEKIVLNNGCLSIEKTLEIANLLSKNGCD